MSTVGEIFDFLCEKFPLETACDFDNPGLLVGDKNAKVNRALIALDCGRSAIETAKAKECELIITHHPVIWDGLKSVTAGDTVFELIKNGIAVISMHTNLDVGNGGVNDELCNIIGLKNTESFVASDGYLLRFGDTGKPYTADDFAVLLKERLSTSVRYTAGSKPINRVLVCSGSGGGFVEDAVNADFDALVTADVKHSYFVFAENKDFSLFDAGHFATETIITEPLSKLLCDHFKGTDFIPYATDKIRFI